MTPARSDPALHLPSPDLIHNISNDVVLGYELDRVVFSFPKVVFDVVLALIMAIFGVYVKVYKKHGRIHKKIKCGRSSIVISSDRFGRSFYVTITKCSHIYPMVAAFSKAAHELGGVLAQMELRNVISNVEQPQALVEWLAKRLNLKYNPLSRTWVTSYLGTKYIGNSTDLPRANPSRFIRVYVDDWNRVIVELQLSNSKYPIKGLDGKPLRVLPDDPSFICDLFDKHVSVVEVNTKGLEELCKRGMKAGGRRAAKMLRNLAKEENRSDNWYYRKVVMRSIMEFLKKNIKCLVNTTEKITCITRNYVLEFVDKVTGVVLGRLWAKGWAARLEIFEEGPWLGASP